MSKAYGMAGLRIGWIVCQNIDMLMKIEQMKHYTSICNSAPAEVLSLIALKNSDLILTKNNAIVAENLTLLDKFFDEYKDLFSWVRPEGGCVGFVKYNSPEESVDVFCDRLVKQRGVLLLPASIYDTPSNHFRIGFGRKSMPLALEEFKMFLNSYNKDNL
jgi:aspartate/methionine/tyrosine aminotransferase